MRQMVAKAPGWAPAWKLLADALLAAGDAGGARSPYEAVVGLDPDGALGAKLDLARLGALAPQEAMQAGYVAALFDDYADRFEAHLTRVLAYSGPRSILEAVRELRAAAGRDFRFAHALDLGSGTGLMGEAIRPHAVALCGVDLSPLMVARARAKLVYDRLVVGELREFLQGDETRFDLVLAADVLCYVGDLPALFCAVAARLEPHGLFAFTLQAAPPETPEGFTLGADNRFAHSANYVVATAVASGLRLAHLAQAAIRQEAGRDVPGFVAVLEWRGG